MFLTVSETEVQTYGMHTGTSHILQTFEMYIEVAVETTARVLKDPNRARAKIAINSFRRKFVDNFKIMSRNHQIIILIYIFAQRIDMC